MKHLLLIAIFLITITGFSQLDTVQCSSQFPSYINDAKILALRDIISKNDPYKDSVIIPASHYIPILRDLNAIAQYGNLRINSHYPYAAMIDSIFGILNVHARADANASAVSLSVDRSVFWGQNLYHDSILSGNDTLDNLVNQYGLYYSTIYQSIMNTYAFNLLALYPINMKPIKEKVSTIAFTSSVDYGHLIGDGSDIYMVDSGNVRHYTFRYGGGDCPSGCTINYFWEFSVYPNCIVKFDTSYGFASGWIYGIKDVNTDKFKVYPNPATAQVSVELDGYNFNGAVLKVINLEGSFLSQKVIRTNKTDIDISTLSPGIYDLELLSDKIDFHRKMVVY